MSEFIHGVTYVCSPPYSFIQIFDNFCMSVCHVLNMCMYLYNSTMKCCNFFPSCEPSYFILHILDSFHDSLHTRIVLGTGHTFSKSLFKAKFLSVDT